MPLALVELQLLDVPLPAQAKRLIRDAQSMIERFADSTSDEPVVAFVPSDFTQVQRAFTSIEQLMLAPGHRFLEWGCGIGAVTCLAGMTGFDAIGIEIERPLVELSRELADDHAVDAQFVEGTFIPEGAEQITDRVGDVAWIRSDGKDAYSELSLDADDFDLIFAYPWPGEERIIFELFEEHGAVGALLLTFHGQEGLQLRRKVVR